MFQVIFDKRKKNFIIELNNIDQILSFIVNIAQYSIQLLIFDGIRFLIIDDYLVKRYIDVVLS